MKLGLVYSSTAEKKFKLMFMSKEKICQRCLIIVVEIVNENTEPLDISITFFPRI